MIYLDKSRILSVLDAIVEVNTDLCYRMRSTVASMPIFSCEHSIFKAKTSDRLRSHSNISTVLSR